MQTEVTRHRHRRPAQWALLQSSATMTILLICALQTGCSTPSRTKSASSEDDIQICRQFLAEAGITMDQNKTNVFHPNELTLGQLRVLAPSDPRFTDATFLVFSRAWQFNTNDNLIVIL